MAVQPPGEVVEIFALALIERRQCLTQLFAVCRDNQHLLEVTSAIRDIEGVAETDTAVILSELKDSYRFSDSVRPA